MSIKNRLRRLEAQRGDEWEAPMFVIMGEEDAPRVEALRQRYAAEIERDKARGRQLFGIDFRLHE
jgi:hypothetical protein